MLGTTKILQLTIKKFKKNRQTGLEKKKKKIIQFLKIQIILVVMVIR